MSKILFVLVFAVCSFSFAKGTASRQPANHVDPLAPHAAADPLAPLPDKSCDEAFKDAQSGKISDVEEAVNACSEAVDKACAKLNDGTGDGRYVSGYCRAEAAHAGYKKVKGKK